jgi:hypothetical protein
MNRDPIHERQPLAASQRFAAPIWVLLLLSPFIAEVLSGSTRTSFLFVFVPEVMVWGVGALLCRELVRRWRAGGTSLLLLGMALSIAEEFIIQQTSLAPLPFPGSHPGYGRMWGINLVYLLFMLGFESIWVVVVPVQLTELFFPRRAVRPWLHRRGMIAACIVFLLGSRIAWYGWTQKARPRLNAALYHPPLGLIALGFFAIATLITLAWFVRGFGQPRPDDPRRTAPLWLGGLTAFAMGAAWFKLIGENFIALPVEPFWIAIMSGIAWAVAAFVLFVWWSSRPAWDKAHRFAAATGATLACMAAPYETIATWQKVDVVGVAIFDALMLIGFVFLARNIFAGANAVESPRFGES